MFIQENLQNVWKWLYYSSSKWQLMEMSKMDKHHLENAINKYKRILADWEKYWWYKWEAKEYYETKIREMQEFLDLLSE